MMKTTLFSLATLLAATSAAVAQDKKGGGGGGGMEMPKPAAELQQYKMMVGTWKCTGKMTMMGKEIETTSTYKADWSLDGHYVVANIEGKAKGMPGTHKGVSYYGYDPASKMYVVTDFDNMGGWAQMKSKGWEGDKQDWAGRGAMMGKEMDMKISITKKGDKEITLSGGMGTDTYSATCKK